MGASQSNGGDIIPSCGDNSAYHHSTYYASNHRAVDKRKKEKPSQPKKPIATDVGHSSITLSWSAPRNLTGNSIIAYTLEMVILSPAVDRQWRTVTKCCQGTSYEVRHLDPDTGYVFRVRAENVYGVSKPSLASEVITTRMFESSPVYSVDCAPTCVPPEFHSADTPGQNFKRRHSFNVHLDGNIAKILNHTDIVLSPAPSSTHSSQHSESPISRNSILRTSLQNRKISQSIILPGTGTNSLNRLRESRTSLKSSTSTGQSKTRELARNKYRDSCGSSGSTISESNVSTSTEDLKKADLGSLSSLHSDTTVSNCRDLHIGGGSKNVSVDSISDNSDRKDMYSTGSVNRKNSLDTMSNESAKDVIYDLLDNTDKGTNACDVKPLDNETHEIQESSKNFEITVEKLQIHDLFQEKLNSTNVNSFGNSQALKGYYEHLESPWEKSESTDGTSQHIMSIPLYDDIKTAKVALTDGDLNNGLHTAVESEETSPCVRYNTQRDFRALRSVLQSNNMIVKSSRSLPDVAGMIIGEKGEVVPINKGRLTTIVDADEEEDSVRITTL